MEDEAGRWILVVTCLGAGALLVWIGAKQRAGTLRRNWFVGLRTPATMRSDEAWLAAHTATAGLVIAAGLVQLAGGVALAVLGADDTALAVIVVASAGVTVALVLVAGAQGQRIAKRGAPEGSRQEDHVPGED